METLELTKKEKRAEYRRKYNKEKSEFIAAKLKEYQQKNKEKISAKGKEYRKNNPEKIKEYRKENAERIAEKQREWRINNADSIAKYNSKYAKENTARINENRKINYKKNKEDMAAKKRAYDLVYREKNLNKKREYHTRYMRGRIENDPIFALKKRIRNLIWMSLSKKNYTKKSRTHEILGCDYETFAAHIESQFKGGMSWENRSEWHINHIIPLATAKTESEILRLNHYTNLQPLWAEENLKKGANYE